MYYIILYTYYIYQYVDSISRKQMLDTTFFKYLSINIMEIKKNAKPYSFYWRFSSATSLQMNQSFRRLSFCSYSVINMSPNRFVLQLENGRASPSILYSSSSSKSRPLIFYHFQRNTMHITLLQNRREIGLYMFITNQ